MVVSGTNGGAFCKDFGSVQLSQLTGRISVNYVLSLPDASQRTFTENYTPNDNGVVSINDLGELAFSYFDQLPMFVEGVQSVDYFITLSASVIDEFGTNLGQFSQRFFYANCRTKISNAYTYRGFLSRHHRRKIALQQTHFIGFFLNGQVLGIGVSYKSGGKQMWSEFTTQMGSDSMLYYRSLGVYTVVELLYMNKGIIVAASEVFYYIVYLKADDKVIDAMQVDVDQNHYPQTTHFIYYNCFGIPDSMRFTGKDQRTTEMDASFVSIRKNYLKVNSKYNIYHEVNSGFITDILRDCAEDLVNSEAVYLYQGSELGERVTVTDVSFDESRPRTEPINVRVKYRLASECQRTIDRDMTVDYRIFDHTFGEEFE